MNTVFSRWITQIAIDTANNVEEMEIFTPKTPPKISQYWTSLAYNFLLPGRGDFDNTIFFSMVKMYLKSRLVAGYH